MKKIATIAFAFILGASILAGCRGGNSTDMTTMPTEITKETGSTLPSQNGTRGRIGGHREHDIHNGVIESHIDRHAN